MSQCKTSKSETNLPMLLTQERRGLCPIQMRELNGFDYLHHLHRHLLFDHEPLHARSFHDHSDAKDKLIIRPTARENPARRLTPGSTFNIWLK